MDLFQVRDELIVRRPHLLHQLDELAERPGLSAGDRPQHANLLSIADDEERLAPVPDAVQEVGQIPGGFGGRDPHAHGRMIIR